MLKMFVGPLGYAVANIFSAVSGFIIVPLLTRSMSVDEFASWIVMEPAIVLLGQILMLGLGHAVLQQIGEAKLDHKNVLYSHIHALFGVSLGCFGLGFLAIFIFGVSALVFSLNVIAEVLLGYIIYYARAANRLGLYYASAVVRPLMVVSVWGLGLYLALGDSWLAKTQSAEEFLWVRFGVAALVFISIYVVVLFLGRKESSQQVRFDKGLVYDAALFGFPLTIASALVALQDFIVRYLLANFVRPDVLIDYYVHLKAVALVGNFVVTPLAIWWGAERYRAMAKGEAYFTVRANGVMMKSAALYGLLSAGFLAVLPWIIGAFNSETHSSAFLASMLLAVPFTQMLVHLTNAGLMRKGVTKYQILVQVISLVTVSLACIGLIQWMSLGVAGAFLLANILALIFSHSISVKFYPAQYSVLKSIFVASVVFSVAYGSLYFLVKFLKEIMP